LGKKLDSCSLKIQIDKQNITEGAEVGLFDRERGRAGGKRRETRKESARLSGWR